MNLLSTVFTLALTFGLSVVTEPEAYVFDDVLVSYPPPIDEGNFGVSSLWLKAHNPDSYRYPEQITNRFEHAAVMSREGSMFIWGGQFQDTSAVKGVWMINVAGSESQVSFILAESDGIFGDYEATLTALHTIVLMMMFLSMTLTLLLGLTQRYNELIMQQTNGDATVRALEDLANQDQFTAYTSRGRGLHPQIIDTLPEKTYSSNEGADEAADNDESNEEECCPICLGEKSRSLELSDCVSSESSDVVFALMIVEYEDGDSLRVLPCNHYMHKSCVDSWLVNNPSCPSCRHSLSELVDDRPLTQLRALRSRLSRRSATMRRFRHYHSAWTDSEDGDNSEVELGPSFDIRFISTLEMLEEGGENDTAQHRDVDLSEIDRMPQRERTSRLARLRRNLDRMRRERAGSSAVPLAEPLDDETGVSIT